MEHKQIQLEAEILEILAKLGIPVASNATEILKTIVLSAVTAPDSFDLDDQKENSYVWNFHGCHRKICLTLTFLCSSLLIPLRT